MTVSNIATPLEKLDSKNDVVSEWRRQPFTWSSFDNATRGDIVYAGQCGAGKNLLIQEEAVSLLGLGGRVIVLDIGRSYQKLGQLLEAQFIRITNQCDLSLNPFSDLVGLQEDYQQYEFRSNLTMIKQVLSSMLSPSGTLDDLENSYLEMALDVVTAQKGPEAEVSDVAAWFLAHSDSRVNDMGTRLYSFTKDGIYGKFFAGKSTISFTNRLIIVEFEDIKQNKELSAVVLQILIVNIMTLVYKSDRSTKFGIIIGEEAREFLADTAGGEKFIEIAAQQAHKYGGFLIVV